MLKIPKCEGEATSVILTGDPGLAVRESAIDLYDTPIDQRPLPKFTIEFVIDYLREHGDHYGAKLLEAYDPCKIP